MTPYEGVCMVGRARSGKKMVYAESWRKPLL